MVDLLKKAGLFTAEVVSITADKVQEVADDFVRKGTLHDSAAKKFVSEVRGLLESREKEFLDKLEQINKGVSQIGDTLGLNPKKEKEANLDHKIEELEKQLEELKARRDTASKEAKKEPVNAGANKNPNK